MGTITRTTPVGGSSYRFPMLSFTSRQTDATTFDMSIGAEVRVFEALGLGAAYNLGETHAIDAVRLLIDIDPSVLTLGK